MTDRRGLLVDYGGVLTRSVGRSFRDFERAEGLAKGTVFELMRDAYGGEDSPVARFERGELALDAFESELAHLLSGSGVEIGHEGIVERIFGGMRPEGRMWDVVAQARDAGVRTVLVSNSWGDDHYPSELVDRHFDATVISGEEGIRKPSPAIFLLGAERAGLPAEACAFVDDLDLNVEVARQLGMFGVHHRDPATTAEALGPFLGVSFDLGTPAEQR